MWERTGESGTLSRSQVAFVEIAVDTGRGVVGRVVRAIVGVGDPMVNVKLHVGSPSAAVRTGKLVTLQDEKPDPARDITRVASPGVSGLSLCLGNDLAGVGPRRNHATDHHP
jgi:hypothetical protein